MLRGGPYAERSVIDLLNRRFVCFFYNLGEGDHGWDGDADKWFTKHKLKAAYSAVYTAAGKKLKDLNNDGDKYSYFAELRGVLDKNPDYDKSTEAEAAAQDAAGSYETTAQQWFDAARIHEELGKYDKARNYYDVVEERADAASALVAEAQLAMARICRYEKKWEQAKPHLTKLDELKALPADVAVERGHALLAYKEYEQARKLLAEAAKAHAESRVIGELHYYAGVACWYLKRKDWANFHWYHVIENLPDDRHYQRAWLSVAIEAIPFPFAELPGQGMGTGAVTHDSANKARKKAKEDYQRLKEVFSKEDYWTADEEGSKEPERVPEEEKQAPPDSEEEEEF